MLKKLVWAAEGLWLLSALFGSGVPAFLYTLGLLVVINVSVVLLLVLLAYLTRGL